MDHLLNDGWYLMEGISPEYRINISGKIFNVTTGHIHPVHYNTLGASKRCYHATLKDEYGFTVDKAIHRLVALTFLKKPEHLTEYEFEDLQVFHTDGDKTNNHVNNLEWTTQKEYTRRIRAVEGYSTATTVVAKHVVSEEILTFFSISAAAKHAGICQASLNKHLDSEAAGRIQGSGWVYKLKNDQPWPDIVFPELEHLRLTRVADLIVKKENDTRLFVFNSVAEAARLLNLNLIGLRNHFSRHGFNQPYDGYTFHAIDDYFRKI